MAELIDRIPPKSFLILSFGRSGFYVCILYVGCNQAIHNGMRSNCTRKVTICEHRALHVTFAKHLATKF